MLPESLAENPNKRKCERCGLNDELVDFSGLSPVSNTEFSLPEVYTNFFPRVPRGSNLAARHRFKR
jgi:hypothetical protein